MPVSLSVKNAPDDIVKRLKQRAAHHHRSLQGEPMQCVAHAAEVFLASVAVPGARVVCEDIQSCIVNPKARSNVGKP